MTNEQIHQNIETQREWLIEHKKTTGHSWSVLAQQTGVASGTLSQFGSDRGYAGDESKIADQIALYRAKLESHRVIKDKVMEAPSYFSTPTSEHLMNLLSYVQLGRMAAAAMGAGTGKTQTAKHFQQCFPKVIITTISPTSSTPGTMVSEVLRALGEKNARGMTHKRAALAKDMIRAKCDVLIMDECQHLSTESFEEIRSWHDETGVGIALFGNYSMMARIEGRSRSSDFAQIFSRIGLKHTLNLPLRADAMALADAWEFEDDKMRDYIFTISQKPGGLRGVTQMIEVASMFAKGEDAELDVNFLKEAWGQLSTSEQR